MAVVSSCCKM